MHICAGLMPVKAAARPPLIAGIIEMVALGVKGTGQATGVADGFVAYEHIDVFAELAFFGEKADRAGRGKWPRGVEEPPGEWRESSELNFSALFAKNREAGRG